MSGVRVPRTPNVAGVCERVVSLYIIDKSFKVFGKGAPHPPKNCAANSKERKRSCTYDLTVRASHTDTCI